MNIWKNINNFGRWKNFHGQPTSGPNMALKHPYSYVFWGRSSTETCHAYIYGPLLFPIDRILIKIKNPVK